MKSYSMHSNDYTIYMPFPGFTHPSYKPGWVIELYKLKKLEENNLKRDNIERLQFPADAMKSSPSETRYRTTSFNDYTHTDITEMISKSATSAENGSNSTPNTASSSTTKPEKDSSFIGRALESIYNKCVYDA